MSSTTALQPSHHAASHTKLDTIPPELRAVIYAQLYNNLCLQVSQSGELSTQNYPWKLSAVSRLLRAETLPILHGESQAYPLRLVCDGGRFPDKVRRHIPNRILNGISIITIQHAIEYDDLKPSLTTFPNLSELRLALGCVNAPDRWGTEYLARYAAGTFSLPLPDDEVRHIIDGVKHESIMTITAELKREQERPREGLERDYLVEGTLHQVLGMDRRRRGFDVKMEATLTKYDNIIYKGDCHCGMIRIDDWDSGRGSHFGDLMTGPSRLYI